MSLLGYCLLKAADQARAKARLDTQQAKMSQALESVDCLVASLVKHASSLTSFLKPG